MSTFHCDRCNADYFNIPGDEYICPNTNCYSTLKAEAPSGASSKEHILNISRTGTTSLLYTELESKVLDVFTRAFHLWRDRQAKYGPTNIAGTGALGCYVRSCDKLARLRQVYLKNTGVNAPDETIVDSWLDLLNYAMMGLMCHEGDWPGVDQ
jgi:hypothetical protein